MRNPFLPGETVESVKQGRSSFTGALLFADISGFTEITEILSREGKDGIEELTSLLNGCFKSMLETIFDNRGSVLTFSGDSILASFSDPGFAETCGKALLKTMIQYRRVVITGKRFSIAIKTVVGKGSWNHSIAGSRKRAYLLTRGTLVTGMARAEELSSPGEMVVVQARSGPSGSSFHIPGVSQESFLSMGITRLEPEHRTAVPLFLHACHDPVLTEGTFQELVVSVQKLANKRGGHLHHIDCMCETGTRMLVLFGAPVSLGNDTLNAVLTAMDISRLSIEGITLGCGIDAGFVYAGITGNHRRKQYTVIGDPVNTAARISGVAPPGSVTVSEGVASSTAGEILYTSGKTLELKGKREPLQVHMAEAVKHSGSHEFFCGRKGELEKLLSMAAERKPPVLLYGSAGVGKSTILRELETRLGRKGENVISTSAEPGEGLLAGLLVSAAGIRASMSASLRKKALYELIDRIDSAELSRRAVFPANMLLKLNIPHGDFDAMPPKLRRENLLDAIVLLLSSLDACVLVDDLQQGSSEELDFLMTIMERVRNLSDNCFFLLAGRDQCREHVRKEAVPVHLPVQGMAEEEASILLLKHSEGHDLSKGLEKLILEKAGGNPFILVQFFSFLREKKLIALQRGKWVRTGSFNELPESVFSMIMARIDTLSEPTRETLKLASAAGMSFPEKLLNDLAGRKVHSDLLEACTAGLTFIRSASGRMYSFSHSLIRDVAYDSIFTERRKELHRQTGLILEKEQGTGRPSPSYLADHFLKGELWGKAVSFLMEAGREAANEYRNGEALTHFAEAARVLESHLPDQRNTLAECMQSTGAIHDRTGNYRKARECHRKAIAVSRDPALTRKALMSLADIIFNQGNIDESLEIIDEVELLLQRSSDEHPDTMEQVLAFRAWTCCVKGELEKAEEYAVKAVETAESLQGFSKLEKARKIGHAINTLATVYWAGSDYKAAGKLYERAIRIALKNNLKREAAVTWGNIGLTQEKAGNFSEAVTSIEKQLQISEEIGEKLLMLSAHGELCMTLGTMGNYERAEHHGRKQLELSGTIQVAHDRLLALNSLASFHILRGELEEAAGMVDSAFALLEDKYIEREMAHTLQTAGKLAMAEKHMEKASDCLERALELADRVNGLSLKHGILLDRAVLFLAENDLENAIQQVRLSIEIADETGMPMARALSILHRGMILEKTGSAGEALNRYTESAGMFRELGSEHNLAKALAGQARNTEDKKRADCLQKEALELFRRMKLQPEM